MARTVDPSPAQLARGVGHGFANSTGFEVLSRAGFVARGLIYGIIGLPGVRGRGERHGEADESAGRASDGCGRATGWVLARSPGHRARRVRDLATSASRARPWSGGGGQHVGAARRARERPCIRELVRRGDRDPDGLVQRGPLLEAPPYDRRRLRLARGTVACRSRGDRAPRSRRLPAHQGCSGGRSSRS